MKPSQFAAWSAILWTAHAAADKYGVAEAMADGSSPGSFPSSLLVWWAIGGLCGYLYAKHQQSKGRSFATDGGVIGGIALAFFASPVLMLLR